ncbi:hypothetical protein BHE74_00054823 [Ensete ventricosum]|nr:hypothetical protein BHE74_00054823 [Ensete ventricosum]
MEPGSRAHLGAQRFAVPSSPGNAIVTQKEPHTCSPVLGGLNRPAYETSGRCAWWSEGSRSGDDVMNDVPRDLVEHHQIDPGGGLELVGQ